MVIGEKIRESPLGGDHGKVVSSFGAICGPVGNTVNRIQNSHAFLEPKDKEPFSQVSLNKYLKVKMCEKGKMAGHKSVTS